ncbi:MAG: ribosome small subunit-dependent GTPase A [Gemmatimonadaceae bacterium]
MADNNTFESLQPLGWTSERAKQFSAHIARGQRPARVVALHRGIWIIDDGSYEQRAKISGRLRHDTVDEATLPTVGDWVAVSGAPNADAGAVLHAVAPRGSALLRKTPGRESIAQALAANVDLVLLAAALPNDVNVRRLERAIALVWESGAMPVVLLTKADLAADVAATLAATRARLTGIDVLALSTMSGEGMNDVAAYLRPAQTAVLLGPSGAGKSTLLNALMGDARMRTSAVLGDGRGRHTTTHRQLFRLPNGALLIDTPGLRELQLWGEEDSVDATFDDVATLASACRFADCAHESEPGCSVLDAVARGALDAERLAHWRQLRAELAYLARREEGRAAQEWKRLAASGARALRAHIKSKYRKP